MRPRQVSRTGQGKPFVFFDLGETLVELRPLLESLAELLREEYPSLGAVTDGMAVTWIVTSSERMPRNPAAPFATEHAVASRVLQELLADLGVSADIDHAGRLLRRAWDLFEDHVALFPDASLDWLAAVRRASAGVGLVTDGDSENLHRLLRRLRLDSAFDSVTMSEVVRAYKPNPVIYKEALASIRAEPVRSLFVSDTPLDLQGAIGVGMAGALVRRGPLSERGSLPVGVIRLESLRELLPILEGFPKSGRFEKP